MARPAKVVYSAEEVKLIGVALAATVLHNVVSTLTSSGAPASPEVGVVLMHHAAGAVNFTKKVEALEKELSLDAERLAHIQELVGGFFK